MGSTGSEYRCSTGLQLGCSAGQFGVVVLHIQVFRGRAEGYSGGTGGCSGGTGGCSGGIGCSRGTGGRSGGTRGADVPSYFMFPSKSSCVSVHLIISSTSSSDSLSPEEKTAVESL